MAQELVADYQCGDGQFDGQWDDPYSREMAEDTGEEQTVALQEEGEEECAKPWQVVEAAE